MTGWSEGWIKFLFIIGYNEKRTSPWTIGACPKRRRGEGISTVQLNIWSRVGQQSINSGQLNRVLFPFAVYSENRFYAGRPKTMIVMLYQAVEEYSVGKLSASVTIFIPLIAGNCHRGTKNPVAGKVFRRLNTSPHEMDLTSSPDLWSEKAIQTNTAARLPMNRFQAMAKIMAMLSEEENLKQGSREYKIARKLVSKKIERLGPETALLQVADRRHQLMEQIGILMSLDDSGIPSSHLDF
jgi:hypothetical protein